MTIMRPYALVPCGCVCPVGACALWVRVPCGCLCPVGIIQKTLGSGNLETVQEINICHSCERDCARNPRRLRWRKTQPPKSPLSGGLVTLIPPLSGGLVTLIPPLSGGLVTLIPPLSGGLVTLIPPLSGGLVTLIPPLSGGLVTLIPP